MSRLVPSYLIRRGESVKFGRVLTQKARGLLFEPRPVHVTSSDHIRVLSYSFFQAPSLYPDIVVFALAKVDMTIDCADKLSCILIIVD